MEFDPKRALASRPHELLSSRSRMACSADDSLCSPERAPHSAKDGVGVGGGIDPYNYLLHIGRFHR